MYYIFIGRLVGIQYTFIKHKFTQPANYNTFSYSFYMQKYIYI